MLNEFVKEVKSFSLHVISSLLLSKIEVNYPFAIKAKALYVIEFISKKSEDYLLYFKNHASMLKEFPEPEDNVENYRKILRTVLNVIGEPLNEEKTTNSINFVDPGYNAEDVKSTLNVFINENSQKIKKGDNKKPIIGPGQSKLTIKKETQQINNQLLNINLIED